MLLLTIMIFMCFLLPSQSYQINSTFTAEWILVALWLNVPVYPHYYVEKYSQYYSSSYWDRVLNDVRKGV